LFLLIVLRDGFVKMIVMIVAQSHLGDAALTSGGWKLAPLEREGKSLVEAPRSEPFLPTLWS